MELTLDTIDGASVELSTEKSAAVRTGVVTDIPAAARSDPFVLSRAILEAGGPALYSPHPYFTMMRLTRISARPAAGTNDAAVQFFYEGPSHNEGPNGVAILVVEDVISLCTEQTQVDPTGAVLQASYTIQGTSDGSSSPQDTGTVKTGSVPVLRPRRTLTVSGLMFGRTKPAAWNRTFGGRVNANPWPTGSLWADDTPDPRGYWLCNGVSAGVDRYKYQVFEDAKTRPYRVRASFTSRIVRDWGEMLFYRSPAGFIPKDVGNTPAKAAAIKALIESPYEPGQKEVGGFPGGVTKCCNYDVANLSMMF